MSPPTMSDYLHGSLDDEHSQRRPPVDTRPPDLRTMGPGYIPPSFEPPTTSPFPDSGELDRLLSLLLSQFDNVLPIPSSPHPFYDNSTVSGYEARQSSEPSVFYPSQDPAHYSPRRISSWPDQSATPANESLHPYPSPLPPDQPLPHLLQTDATPWTGVDNVNIPLCLSPTSIPPTVPDAFPIEYPTPKEGLAHYQTPPSTRGSSSTRSSTSQTSLESTPATDVTMGLVAGVPQLTLFDAQPLVGNVTVLPQRRYQERQWSRMLSCAAPQVICLGTYGYPVSSVTAVQSRKGQSLPGLADAKRRAFRGIDVGQKLSWRFLFEKSIEFERQFNVLDAKKTQPSIERIIFETVKALKCFTEQEPRFAYPLDHLVILEIELVSRASVQAKIGVLETMGAGHQGWAVPMYG